MVVIDPIFGNLTLDEQAVRLLSDEAVRREKRRLEQVKCLGFISTVFPSATHSIWEHQLGMYLLARAMKGMSADDLRILGVLCLLGGMGHLPFSRASEDAVLIAGSISSKFARNFLRRFCEPVLRACNEYEQIDRASKLHQLVFEQGDSRAVHTWLSAYKLRALPKGVDVGHRNALMFHRISATSHLHKLYRTLSRIDYVQRDLHYTGLARFSISPSAIFQNFNGSVDSLDSTPELNLLSELRQYLADTLYLHPRALAIESMFSKQLAALLLEEAITVRQLLDSGDAILEENYDKFDPEHPLDELRYAPFQTVTRAQFRLGAARENLLSLESLIMGLPRNIREQRAKLLDSPWRAKQLVVVRSSRDPATRRPSAGVFVLARKDGCDLVEPVVRSIANLAKRSPANDYRKLGLDLLAYILSAQRIQPNDDRIVTVLANAITSATRKQQERLLKPLRDEDVLWRWSSRRRFVFPSVMRPLFGRPISRAPEDYRGLLRLVIGGERPTFIRTHLQQFLTSMRSLLNSAIRQGEVEKSEGLEGLVLLDEIIRCDRRPIRWVFPLVAVEQSKENKEIDIISVSMHGKKTFVRLIECTKNDSASKALHDMRKLQRMVENAGKFTDLSFEPMVLGPSKIGKRFIHCHV